MPTFGDHFASFLDEFVALHPTAATAIGDHRYDDRWPDVTEAGRAARLDFVDRWLATLEGLEAGDLTAGDAIDRDLLVMELEAERFADTELRDETWDPLQWVYLLGDGIFPLIARDFAPLAERLTSVAGRLEGVRTVLDGAVIALAGRGDGRPVGRFQTEKALEQLPGIAELIDDALGEAERAAPADPAVAGFVTASRPPPTTPRPRWTRSSVTSPTTSCRAARGRAAWAPTSSPARCATRCGPRR